MSAALDLGGGDIPPAPAPAPAPAIRGDGMFVTLGVDGDVFAAPVERVQEILDLRPIARLPRAPMSLLGMIDVRGRSVPVADLRSLLGMMPGHDDHDTRILVLTLSGGRIVGLKADRVYEVAALDDGRLERPEASSRWDMEAMAGIGRRDGGFVSVLDLDRLLEHEIAGFSDFDH